VFILLGVFFISFANAVVPDDCDPSPVIFLKMDGNSTDSSGNGYDGRGDEDVGYTGSLKVENAASFSGSESIIIVDDDTEVDFGSAFTIEMWVLRDNLLSAVIFEKGDYKIEFIAPMKIVASVKNNEVSFDGVSPDFQTHIAFVWSSSAQKLLLYVNGVKKNETVLASLLSYDGTPELVIGDGFTGKIDELAVYDSALIAGDIASHYSVSSGGNDYCSDVSAGGASFTESTFNIPGCSFDGTNGPIGVSAGKCSTYPGEDAGLFYCDVNRIPYETSEGNIGLGCAMGDIDYTTNSGKEFCCPSGYLCNDSLVTAENPDVFECTYRFENCSSKKDKKPCEDNGCIWVEDLEECVETVTEYSCSTYNESEEQCVADVMRLGKIGIGTELCGTEMVCNGNVRYSIPLENCSCQWFENDKGIPKCQLNIIGVQMFYDTENPGVQQIFNCSNAFTLGDCVDGEMSVEWLSTNDTVQGWDAGVSVPDDCLDAAGCAGGSDVRYCGEPIIKLPGFSFFAFFASLFVIGIYYFIDEKHLNKKGG